jgi:carbon-monoxide dehydrogenase large subunit
MPTVDAAANTMPSASPWLRREDQRLLAGTGCFVGDVQLPGMLHAVFVRSAHAHGRIVAVDADAAQQSPGVRAVFTNEDFAALAAPQVNHLLPGLHLPAVGAVGRDRVLAVGAPLALVLADTRAQAQAAADLVWADIEELPAVMDGHPGEAANLDASVPGNLVATARFGNGSMPQRAPTAQVCVGLPRVAASPMEPRAAVVHWDAGAQQLRAWLSTQTPARAKLELATALGLAADAVHVIAPDVGGAFGGKASVCPEDLMLASAARQLAQREGWAQCALRWQATRGEDLQSAPHGRASHSEGAIWLDAKGRIEALSAQFRFSLGHWLTYSAVVPARNAARIVPGPYQVAQCVAHAEARLSNAAAVGIYRGAGRPEAAILLERLMDAAAHEAGIDPLALRRRCVWPADALPRTLPNGQWLDRCDLPGLLDHAADLFGYAAQRARQASRRQQGQCVGVGMALYVEPCGQGPESVQLTALADGRYRLATGATAQGQGRETSFAQIAADALGCRPDQVDVLQGDTAQCPPGVGALASRSTAIGGSAVLGAAQALREHLQSGQPRPCTVDHVHTAEHEAWASGCVMVAVAVDVATGALTIEDLVWVDDAGHVVHPALVQGQLLGGLAQGLGQATMERVVYDAQGQLLSGSLMDYALPRAADMPERVRLASHPTPSAANPLGAKGVGEAGCIGVPAALLNAALDALAPLGVRELDFPMSPGRLWQAIQDARPQAKPTPQ